VGVWTATVDAEGATGDSGHTTFNWTIGSPAATSRSSIAGLSRGRARLSLRVLAGRYSPLLAAVVVALPKGLSFAHNPIRGVTVRGPGGKPLGFTATAVGSVLTITLSAGVGTAQITIASPAIRVTHALAAKVRTKRVTRLAVTVVPIDASRQPTRLELRLRV